MPKKLGVPVRVVPGSQLQDFDRETNRTQPPEGAEPVFIPRGGAVIFDRRTWHSATSNASDVCRKAIFYGYSYRWLRPRDDQSVEHLIEDCDPIRRQLLGHGATGGFGYTSPSEEDVPLSGVDSRAPGRRSNHATATSISE